MSDSFKALCNDFYVNQKLSVKMDLPRGRETVLDLFERVRKQFSGMTQFRRYRDELALESSPTDSPHRWLAVRANNVRSGVVNPPDLREAYSLHRHVLEVSPYFLNVSPLDIDYVELLYGFDLHAGGNHDAIVFEALYAGSPMAELCDISGASPVECQPVLGICIGNRGELEVQFEVKTRGTSQPAKDPDAGDPISVYLTLRRFGSPKSLEELSDVTAELAAHGEELVQTKVVPKLVVPIRDAIASGNA